MTSQQIMHSTFMYECNLGAGVLKNAMQCIQHELGYSTLTTSRVQSAQARHRAVCIEYEKHSPPRILTQHTVQRRSCEGRYRGLNGAENYKTLIVLHVRLHQDGFRDFNCSFVLYPNASQSPCEALCQKLSLIHI